MSSAHLMLQHSMHMPRCISHSVTTSTPDSLLPTISRYSGRIIQRPGNHYPLSREMILFLLQPMLNPMDFWKTWIEVPQVYRKNKKVHQSMVNQAKLKSKCHASIYQFCICVPHNTREAAHLDEINGDNKWSEAMDKELSMSTLFMPENMTYVARLSLRQVDT